MGRGDLLFAVTENDIDRSSLCSIGQSALAYALERLWQGPPRFYGYFVRKWDGTKYALPLSAIQWWERHKATGEGRPGSFVLIPAEFDIFDPNTPPEERLKP